MKKLLIFILLLSPLYFFGQEENQQLIVDTAEKIGIEKSDIYFRLIKTHEFDNQTLLVIPEIAEEDENHVIFNNHVVLIDSQTGAVQAKFSGEKDLYIDAVGINKIEIDSLVYQLNTTTPAYGLKIYYSGQSRPNPYYGTQLSLYALEGDELIKVLKDYPIKTFNGETDTTCKGTFEEHSKKMKVLNEQTNDYADLRFIDSVRSTERNEDCEVVDEEKREIVEILKYENGQYKPVRASQK